VARLAARGRRQSVVIDAKGELVQRIRNNDNVIVRKPTREQLFVVGVGGVLQFQRQLRRCSVVERVLQLFLDAGSSCGTRTSGCSGGEEEGRRLLWRVRLLSVSVAGVTSVAKESGGWWTREQRCVKKRDDEKWGKQASEGETRG
jgi:hypothetical protein